MLHSWQVSCKNTSMWSLLAANKMKLQIVLKNFTSYPKQSKNTEASKSDKKENSFTARAFAKINPCELVVSFPNSHPSSTATFFTSYSLTFLGSKDSKGTGMPDPNTTRKMWAHSQILHKQTQEKPEDNNSWSGIYSLLYCTILYLIVTIALKLRMQ